MSFTGFTPSDFKVFDIPGFKPRMEAIKTRIRPKLEAVGRELLPDVTRVGGGPASNRKRTPLRETATLKWQCFL